MAKKENIERSAGINDDYALNIMNVAVEPEKS